MNFKFILTISLFFSLSDKIIAQEVIYRNDKNISYEAGISVAAMNCLTDLGGHKGLGQSFLKDLNTGKTNFAASLYFGALYQNQYGVRLEYTYGHVQASDDVLKNNPGSPADPRYDRNLSFKSVISEIALIGEIYPTYIINHYDVGNRPKLAPYIMVGIGYFHFNPKALYNGQWVDLQPLSLEGQGFSEYPNRPQFKLNQINFPLGLGIRYGLNENLNLKAEFIFRKLSTDYLDGVSTTYIDPALFSKYLSEPQLSLAKALAYRGNEIGKDHDHNPGAPRGNPKNNDSYFTFNIKIGYVFGNK